VKKYCGSFKELPAGPKCRLPEMRLHDVTLNNYYGASIVSGDASQRSKPTLERLSRFPDVCNHAMTNVGITGMGQDISALIRLPYSARSDKQA
jgi:hypothetical protein